MAEHLPKRIALKTHHGTYVGALENDQVRLVPHCKEWEIFEVEKQHDKVSLKTFKGRYISARDKESVPVKTVEHSRDWEQFKVHQVGPDQFAFQASFGTFLNANEHADKGLALGPALKAWETFTIVNHENYGKVYLKTAHSTFVGALETEQVRLVPHNKGWELFEFERKDDGRYAIKTFKGMYLSARDKEPVAVKAVAQCRDWELFKVIPQHGGHRFSILSHHGTYLAAHGSADKGLYLTSHNGDAIFEFAH